MIRLYGRIRDRLDRQQLLAAVSLFGSSYNGSRPVFRLLFPRTKPVHRSVALEITLYRNLTTSALDVRRVAHRFLNKSRRVGAKLVARDNVKFYFSLLTYFSLLFLFSKKKEANIDRVKILLSSA